MIRSSWNWSVDLGRIKRGSRGKYIEYRMKLEGRRNQINSYNNNNININIIKQIINIIKQIINIIKQIINIIIIIIIHKKKSGIKKNK